MRVQTMFLVNIQLKKKDRVSDAHKFMPLPWDDEEEEDDGDGEYTPPKIDLDAFKAFSDGIKNNSKSVAGAEHSNG